MRPFWHILRMSSRRTSFSWCVYVLSMCSVKRDEEGIFGIALAAGLGLRYLVLRGAANDTRVVPCRESYAFLQVEAVGDKLFNRDKDLETG